jgi:hypothetical protein
MPSLARFLAISSCFALAAAPASAVPVVDVLSGTDATFTFSVVHDSNSGGDGQIGNVIGQVTLGPAGGTWTIVGPIGTLDLELVIDVAGSDSTYDVLGDFDVPGLSEFVTQANVMVGSLSFTLTSGADDAAMDGVTIYFENRNYSSAINPPNGLQGDLLTVWGASNFTGSGVLGEALDLFAGGRGLDIRVQVPEPSASALCLAGLALAGLRFRRRQR